MSYARPVVFLARGIPPMRLKLLQEKFEVKGIQGETRSALPQDVFAQKLEECKPNAALIYSRLRVDKTVLDAAGPQLKVIGTTSAGLEHIDLEECRRRGIQVGYTPDVLTTAVAEHTIGLTLATARKYKEGVRSIHNGVWGTRWGNASWLAGTQMSGSVIGIVGLGRIGFAVAKRVKAFEPARILYCGSQPKKEAAAMHAEYLLFENLLRQSDIIIATCSINGENKGLFNESAFSKMKKSAIFINISRGVLVNQEDLYGALVSGSIGAAGLDVTSPEPLPPDHPLLTLDNCFIVPHIGSCTEETKNAMCDLTIRNIEAGLKGEPLPASAL